MGGASLSWLPFAAFALLALVLYAWGRWVARRHGHLAYRLAARGILAGAAIAFAGAALALSRLSAITPAAPSADLYAHAVTSALRTAAIPIGVGNVVLLISVVVLVVGTIRRPA